ncbi:MAG: thioredoxin family protein [Bacteroidota bacterium]
MKHFKWLKPFRLLLLVPLFLLSLTANSQILKPVKWTFSSKITAPNEALILFTATIDNKWHLYSQNVPPDGPIATSFTLEKSKDYQLVGKVVEPKPISEFDDAFKMTVKYFTKKAIFTQKIKFTSSKDFVFKGKLEFMSCNNGTCVPPEEIEFSIPVKTGVASNDTDQNATLTDTSTKDTTSKAVVNTVSKADSIAKLNVLNKTIGQDDSLWMFFILAFGWGLLAILTPCVFPMIPMTISFFMKSGKKGKLQAIIYGLSIIVIYVIFGVLISVLFGADFGNWLSTHWIPNVFFFIIFVVFAASFFGYFEITAPSWLVNKSVKNEEKGGIIGTIFMALTLVLVSFSCTGPIVGTVVVQAVGGAVIKPVIGMLGFSLAFAIPFTLFAFFPQWLNKMPKSGGWLNSVKVVLGFIELAFALKFLNVPDQTYHWGLLDREVYLAFWIVIFTLMGFYLLGKIKFPHDSDMPNLKSFPRLMLAIFTFTFVVYMIPGLWGAPLKALSGWLPPPETQDFDINSIVRESGGGIKDTSTSTGDAPLYTNILKLPHGLKGYFDYDQALKASKQLKKPVFVDFTGHGCTNCREMENRVWSDKEVLKRLRENFVIVALYVDDKVIEMPEKDWYTNAEGKQIKLLGKKNTEIQIKKFNANAQPFYVILDSDGNLLVTPRAYDLNISLFVKFLDDGIAAFKKETVNK